VEVAVMTPAVGEGPEGADVRTTGFGLFRLVRLNRLKNSALNWRLNFSVSRNFFAREKSVSAIPGPCRKLRGALP
jgi:hypothetical protein